MSDFLLFAVDFETGALQVQYAGRAAAAIFREDRFADSFFEPRLLSSDDAIRHARQYLKQKFGG